MRMKKAMAAMLAAAITVSSALSVFAAATSPTTAPDASSDASSYIDKNEELHTGNEVTSTINAGNTAATAVAATGDSTKAGSAVEFKNATTEEGKNVPITVIGNGKKGVFDSKAGRKIKTLTVNSSAKKVTVKAKAFTNSKVKTVKVATKKLVINKNAFKGTKQKKIVVSFQKGHKKAAALTVKKDAFEDVTKITVKGLSKKQFKKLRTKLVKAGVKKYAIKRG